MTEARAFWTVAPGRGEIRGETLPPPVRIRCWCAHWPAACRAAPRRWCSPAACRQSQHQAMRAPLMGGDFPFPVKYGYSAVGRTTDGRRVFVLHPHQDVFLAPAAMCIPVPDAVPTQRAVLAANMETALNLTWDAAPLAGERMLVIGAGVVGLLTASLLARIPAAQRHGGGHRSGARSPGATVRLRLRLAGRGAGRAGADRARLGQRSRTSARTGPRRLRGAHRRGKLVRRPCARACRSARRSMRAACA